MCGIVGYTGKSDAVKIVVEALKSLNTAVMILPVWRLRIVTPLRLLSAAAVLLI